ncbi:peptide chain release factor N(5)-glutamine methyltransferase [Winogradskyella litorisediminis]|uniref:Release factor glutamine methyltransferase n=1 Tax=Winogradskyella litorisediminis TaxID=1156618 RepID=A0ABW3NAR2_9FLAO
MKALDLKQIFYTELGAIYDKNEVASFFYLCLEHYLDVPRIHLNLEPEFTLSKSEVDTFFSVLNELKTQKPIQYIFGETEFYGLQFKLNDNVLIPRQETEELVDLIIKDAKIQNKESLKILDIGTGSGCIAISLAKHLPKAKIYALDVSKEALQIAKQNAKLNDVNVTFIKADILNFRENDFFPIEKDVSQRQKVFFDIIVSNPPYVRNLEKAEIQPNVLDYEPHLALFVDNDNPLLFYKTIVDFAEEILKANGQLYFEINQYLGKETKQLLIDANFTEIQLLKDLNTNDRMLKGRKL